MRIDRAMESQLTQRTQDVFGPTLSDIIVVSAFSPPSLRWAAAPRAVGIAATAIQSTTASRPDPLGDELAHCSKSVLLISPSDAAAGDGAAELRTRGRSTVYARDARSTPALY